MNAYPDTRWVALRFRFAFVDQEAQADATPYSSAQHATSQIMQTLDNVDQPSGAFVFLEHNRWGLSRPATFLPRDFSNTETGWINSTMSRANCTFASNPYLEFQFTELHSSIGFTLHFDEATGQHASRLRVQTYDAGGHVISSTEQENHNGLCVVRLLSPDYIRVRFTFLETSRPYSRVRVSEVLFGIIETYEANDIVSATLEYSVDPIAEALPSRQTIFRIDNSDQRFNIINPDGIYAYLQQPQSFDVTMGIGEAKNMIEYVSMGQFYFSTASAEDASLTAEITAYDWFYWMEKTAFVPSGTGTWTLAEAVADILSTAGVECEVSIPPSAAAIPLVKITDEMTCREALRLAVQAACCTAYFNRDGQLVILDLMQSSPVDELNNNNMTSPPKVTRESAVNTVQLKVHDAVNNVDVVYTASNIIDDEMAQVKTVNNNMVDASMGQLVATWILQWCQGRITYKTSERGNPATLLTDTVKIYDYFHVNRNTVVTRQVFSYDGGLKVESEAIALGTD
jgi:hypothetical protein